MSCESTAKPKQRLAICASLSQRRATRSPAPCDSVEASPKVESCAAVSRLPSPKRRRAYSPLFATRPHSAK